MSFSPPVKFQLPSFTICAVYLSILFSGKALYAEDSDFNVSNPPAENQTEESLSPPKNSRRIERKGQGDLPAPFAERAITLDIVARIMEKGSDEVWNQSESKVTIPGRPVGIKLVGENIVVSARFTPYFNKAGKGVIVAQGQIWIEVPGMGIHYQTTVQTIPLSLGEEVYFFPLGKDSNDTKDSIEIMVAATPYKEK